MVHHVARHLWRVLAWTRPVLSVPLAMASAISDGSIFHWRRWQYLWGTRPAREKYHHRYEYNGMVHTGIVWLDRYPVAQQPPLGRTVIAAGGPSIRDKREQRRKMEADRAIDDIMNTLKFPDRPVIPTKKAVFDDSSLVLRTNNRVASPDHRSPENEGRETRKDGSVGPPAKRRPF